MNYVVEVKGPLDEKDFERLNAFFKKNAEFLGERHHFFIDFSGVHSGKRFEFRVRVHEGVPELVLRLLGEEKAGREISLKLESGQLDNLVEFLALMGYEEGVLCERVEKKFVYHGMDFSLVEVPRHSYFFEVKKFCEEKEIDEARERILGVIKTLSLRAFSEKELFSYIQELKRSVDGVFNVRDYKPGELASVFSKTIKFKKLGIGK